MFKPNFKVTNRGIQYDNGLVEPASPQVQLLYAIYERLENNPKPEEVEKETLNLENKHKPEEVEKQASKPAKNPEQRSVKHK